MVVFQALLFVSGLTGGGGCCGEEAFLVERDMPFSQRECLNGVVRTLAWPHLWHPDKISIRAQPIKDF